MSESGKIISVDGKFAVIKLKRREACGSCNACDKGDNNDMIMNAKNLCDGEIGDTVLIELEVEKLLFATALMYGLPLVTMTVGFLIGYKIFNNEIISFFLGMIFLLFTYFIIKKNESFFQRGDYTPVAKSVVEKL